MWGCAWASRSPERFRKHEALPLRGRRRTAHLHHVVPAPRAPVPDAFAGAASASAFRSAAARPRSSVISGGVVRDDLAVLRHGVVTIIRARPLRPRGPRPPDDEAARHVVVNTPPVFACQPPLDVDLEALSARGSPRGSRHRGRDWPERAPSSWAHQRCRWLLPCLPAAAAGAGRVVSAPGAANSRASVEPERTGGSDAHDAKTCQNESQTPVPASSPTADNQHIKRSGRVERTKCGNKTSWKTHVAS